MKKWIGLFGIFFMLGVGKGPYAVEMGDEIQTVSKDDMNEIIGQMLEENMIDEQSANDAISKIETMSDETWEDLQNESISDAQEELEESARKVENGRLNDDVEAAYSEESKITEMKML